MTKMGSYQTICAHHYLPCYNALNGDVTMPLADTIDLSSMFVICTKQLVHFEFERSEENFLLPTYLNAPVN